MKEWIHRDIWLGGRALPHSLSSPTHFHSPSRFSLSKCGELAGAATERGSLITHRAERDAARPAPQRTAGLVGGLDSCGRIYDFQSE